MWNALPFPAAITYGDIVEEQYKDAVKPERLLPTSERFVKDLSTLGELYQTKSETIAGIPNPVGPMVVIKAKVSDMRLEPSDYEYDPSGYTYFMRVTSFDLMRSFEDSRRDVGIGIHGFLGDEGRCFEYATDEGYKPYAIKSTVFIYGRLGMTVKDDVEIQKSTPLVSMQFHASQSQVVKADIQVWTNSKESEMNGKFERPTKASRSRNSERECATSSSQRGNR